MVSHDSTSSRRSRMSAQEQLDRMQRNQEAQRKSEAPQSSLTGRWRDSLKRGSSWVGVNPHGEGAVGLGLGRGNGSNASVFIGASRL